MEKANPKDSDLGKKYFEFNIAIFFQSRFYCFLILYLYLIDMNKPCLPAFLLPDYNYLNHIISHWQEIRVLPINVGDTFRKRYFFNRTTILAAGGPEILSVPLTHPRNGKKIKDLKICYDHAWQRVWKGALESAYRKAAFWDYYGELVTEEIDKNHTFLIDLNLRLLEKLLEVWKLKIEVVEEPICSWYPDRKTVPTVKPYFQCLNKGEFCPWVCWWDGLLNLNATVLARHIGWI
jgi:hypothetical protein